MTRITIADAAKASPQQFLDRLGLDGPERREARLNAHYASCIRAIERGDTYGFPPMMVEHCKTIMADGRLVDVEHLGPGRIAA